MLQVLEIDIEALMLFLDCIQWLIFYVWQTLWFDPMKIVLLPQLSDLPPQSIKLLSLRIPGQDEDSMFIFSPVVGLLQLQLWENPINSWAIENTVIQGINIMLKYRRKCLHSNQLWSSLHPNPFTSKRICERILFLRWHSIWKWEPWYCKLCRASRSTR